jgi:hypothetical protein
LVLSILSTFPFFILLLLLLCSDTNLIIVLPIFPQAIQHLTTWAIGRMENTISGK